MSTLYGDSIFTINEAITEIKYDGFSTGVKVQGKSIEIYKHDDRPTKDEIEALIPEIKKSAKLINDGWAQVINASTKKYSEWYNVTKEQAKKDLKYESISLMWSANENPIKPNSFCAYFSSSAMNRDMHSMCVELDIINGKFKVTYAYIDG